MKLKIGDKLLWHCKASEYYYSGCKPGDKIIGIIDYISNQYEYGVNWNTGLYQINTLSLLKQWFNQKLITLIPNDTEKICKLK